MKSVLIVDVETTGLDRDKDSVIELGCILWSVEHRSMIEVYSRVLPAEENGAEAVNGIPAALCRGMQDAGTWEGFASLARDADAVCAHQADFDRAFIERHVKTVGVDWICTREDMVWPKVGGGESLVVTALAHGVAVTSAHRAIHDCLLLARLFEAVTDIDERLAIALARSRQPKARFVSLAPFAQKEVVKEHGFKWDGAAKEWWRVMPIQDAASLPFKTKQVPL